ncbi:MAG: translation initiation factor IF-6 [Candidatus Micrarchaeota archaeon]
MGIEKTSFRKNPFIGLFCRASDKLILLPKTAPGKFAERAEEALGVRGLRLFVNQSELIGLFTCMNSSGVIVPGFAEDEEVRLLKKAGLNVYRTSETHVPGNNMAANDKAVLLNPAIEKPEARRIADCLGVESFSHPFRLPTVGSVTIATNKGVLSYNESSETELKMIERIFGVPAGIGTANLGSAFISLCIIANARGALVGELSSGFEVQRLFEALFS